MLSVVTNEISSDTTTAINLAMEWGVCNFEIKRIFDNRLPYLSEDGYQVLQSISSRQDINIVALGPGLFDKPMNNWLFNWDAGWKLDDSLHLCNKVEAGILVVFGINNTGNESFQQVVDHFGMVAAKAQSAGVTVAIEPHHGNWVESAASANRLLSAVNSDFLGFNYDVSNCRQAGEEPDQGYEIARPWIKHVHIKDSLRTANGKFACKRVGQGDINWGNLFGRFSADDVDVAFSVETHVKPLMTSTKACIEAVSKLMQEAKLKL